MLVGVIQSTRVQELTLTGDDTEELRERLAAQVPDGWVVTDSPITKTKQVPSLSTAAKLAHWGDLAEVEGESIDAVRAAVPDGYRRD
ncbi:hypothetical protein [Microbacterium maritypicum]|uniref:Uncharacterized protein n=1 Tax=Microbacterium maritypicum MF109 TaxID=1333857 RepID=T5KEZ5_MICMQ|nr:hypothetical protein [Microbacterium liquefaciens]EQM74760.1 hypothetical protein L687_04670 [Microbacterium maritypicum MF109]